MTPVQLAAIGLGLSLVGAARWAATLAREIESAAWDRGWDAAQHACKVQAEVRATHEAIAAALAPLGDAPDA